MSTQRRKIRLTFPSSGESVFAEMLEDEVPETCRQGWEWLPLESKTLHGQYFGAEVFILLDNPKPIAPENRTQIPLPGEIFYFYDPGENSTSGNKDSAEICVVYNRGVVLRGPEGV